jgi:hypothetical protein
MKIKTFNRTWPVGPKECVHEWRMFGTRLCESVSTPIRTDKKPEGYDGGWVICDLCGWCPFVYRYEVTGKRPHIEPLLGQWPDVMVKIIEWGKEKEAPNSPIVEEFAYAEWSWWDKLKRKFKYWADVVGIAGGL